ncbi:MAG: cadherin-like beta sandwich domain-containing protein [Clostridia bacterium]|nr:cadherin-like beta sandwich domain-containing protein [Clostridia bacterium]
MKKAKKTLVVVTVLSLIISMIPLCVSAKDNDGQVRIIVQNNTYSVSDGAKWDGTLIDEWVDIDSDSSVLSAFIQAVADSGYTQTGAEDGYVTEIGGLSANDNGYMSGWMATLDDWITDEGLSAYTVSSGKLENGDEICFQYSCDWGADIGYSWSDTSTKLKSISLSGGTLEPEFNTDTTEYTLKLPSDTESVKITPTAENKAYRTKIYKNSYTPETNGTDIKRSSEITLSDEDVIYIGVGNSSWQYTADGVTGTVYKITVNSVAPQPTDKDREKATETEELINSIGTVTVKSKNSIETARNSYNNLTALQQSLVSNYDVLLSAEKSYSAIEKTQVDFNEMFTKTTQKFLDSDVSDIAVAGNEWIILSLVRGEQITDEIRNTYIKSAEDYVKTVGSSKLSNTKSTDNSRFIITLTALGCDVTNIGGYNLLEPYSDYEYLSGQGINGLVYALVSLDTKNYEIPVSSDSANQTTREKLIDSIISSQLSDGGWTFYGDVSDSDMTAMVLQALAPYYNSDNNVKSSVDKALTFLSSNQQDNGSFVSYGSQDCESNAQVITALTALGIDILSDTRFIKNGNTALDGLKLFYNDGTFSHLQNGTENGVSTNQAYYALVSYYRYSQGKTSLYDMSDVEISPVPTESSDNSENSVSDESSDVQNSTENSVNSEESTPTSQQNSQTENKDNSTVNTGDTFAVFPIVIVMLFAVIAVIITKKKSTDR